jgi:hypothetical protein
MTTDIIREAAALIQAGKNTEARRLLEPFINVNLQNIPAWLLEVEAQPTVAGKKKVLEACLRYNPNAPQVQRALAQLEYTLSTPPSQTVLKPPPSSFASSKPPAPSRREGRSGTNSIRIILAMALFIAVCFLGLVYLTEPNCIVPLNAGPCLRILFIGNSYTYANDLPTMFTRLARSGGHKVWIGMAAESGWALSNHVQSTATMDQLKSSKWDFVVLQEQSQIPAIEQSRTRSMYPAARLLVSRVKDVGSIPIFFLTWAHRDGWPENGLPDYESMQAAIDQGYLAIAQELDVGIAPVGFAWQAANGQNPQLGLWQEDGSHPTERGTYLAACVFYATIFRQSPEGLSYRGNLPMDVAQNLQTIASSTVLNDPQQWNLP